MRPSRPRWDQPGQDWLGLPAHAAATRASPRGVGWAIGSRRGAPPQRADRGGNRSKRSKYIPTGDTFTGGRPSGARRPDQKVRHPPVGIQTANKKPNAIMRISRRFRMIRGGHRTNPRASRLFLRMRCGRFSGIHRAFEKGHPNPNASPETKNHTQNEKPIKKRSANDKYRPSWARIRPNFRPRSAFGTVFLRGI